MRLASYVLVGKGRQQHRSKLHNADADVSAWEKGGGEIQLNVWMVSSHAKDSAIFRTFCVWILHCTVRDRTHEHYISWENLNAGCSKNHVLLVQNMCSIELEFWCVQHQILNILKPVFLPNSTDSLHLQLTRVPGSPDLVIFCIHDNNSLCWVIHSSWL